MKNPGYENILTIFRPGACPIEKPARHGKRMSQQTHRAGITTFISKASILQSNILKKRRCFRYQFRRSYLPGLQRAQINFHVSCYTEALLFFALLHRSLQYVTVSQFFSHFLRHEKGSPHTGQILDGKCCFLIPFIRHALKDQNFACS